MTDFAEEWLAAKDEEKTFLLCVSHKGVHADFLPPDPHTFKYDKVGIPTPPTPTANPNLFRDPPIWVRNQSNSRHGVEFAYYTGVDMKKSIKGGTIVEKIVANIDVDELYDLQSDPKERINLFNDSAQAVRVTEMNQALFPCSRNQAARPCP